MPVGGKIPPRATGTGRQRCSREPKASGGCRAGVFARFLLGSQLILVADQVPRLNVEPSCQAAAESAGTSGRNAATCLQDENTARGKLEQEWSQFSATERQNCLQLSNLGGSPSYVELLTCLEMAQAARQLPAADKMEGK